MSICILNFLKTGVFGNNAPLNFSELIPMYGKPNEVFSCAKMFLTVDEINNIDLNDPKVFPIVAAYGDIQFHFHNDRPNLVVCNYSFNRTPQSDHFDLINTSLVKRDMRLAKFLEKMAKHNIDISDISIKLEKIVKARFISVTTAGGVEVSFCHEHGARDFRLCQFVKPNES